MKISHKEKLDKILDKVSENKRKRKQIKKLEKKIAKETKKISSSLLKELKDWQPVKDEKAICFSPSTVSAWAVWFIENIGDWQRFKETPSWETLIQNYYRQNVKSEKAGDWVIVPVEMFEQLNKKLKIGVWDKLEDMSQWNK